MRWAPLNRARRKSPTLPKQPAQPLLAGTGTGIRRMAPRRPAAFAVLLGLGSLVASAAVAAESLPATAIDDLVTLGQEVADTELLKDNVFQYEAAANAAREKAKALEQLQVEWVATVLRVTRDEVLVDAPDAGRTRVVLRHAEPPFFGNLRSVWYCGGPSTEFYNQFAKPTGLRIGSEISLETARQLRRKDRLRILGKLDKVETQIEHVFRSRVLTVIADWVVVGVEPANSR